MVFKDFLEVTMSDIVFHEGKHPKIDVLYLSPPWGGTGYNLLKEYTLDHVFPDFNLLLNKALSFTNNLILFLPRNTSVDDLIERLTAVAEQFSSDHKRKDELIFEIE